MERELLLLGLLRREDMHGYQLHEFIERNMASCTDLKKPTAYHLLDKMLAKGWLTEETEQVGNRPPRRIYRVTPIGETAFQTLLRENLAAHYGARFAGNIGLAFLSELPASEALTQLQQRRTTMQQELTTLEAVPLHHGTFQLLIDHQIQHLRAELVWLDTVFTRLANGEFD